MSVKVGFTVSGHEDDFGNYVLFVCICYMPSFPTIISTTVKPVHNSQPRYQIILIWYLLLNCPNTWDLYSFTRAFCQTTILLYLANWLSVLCTEAAYSISRAELKSSVVAWWDTLYTCSLVVVAWYIKNSRSWEQWKHVQCSCLVVRDIVGFHSIV